MKYKVLKNINFYFTIWLTHFTMFCVAQCTDLFTQESTNKWYCNTMKDLLLPNTVSKKDEKLHTTGSDDTVMPHIKIKVTKLLLCGPFLDRLDVVVVLLVHNHYNQVILSPQSERDTNPCLCHF